MAAAGGTIEARKFIMISDQVVDTPGKFDDVIHPAAFFRSQFGHHALVGKGPAGEIVIPGVPEVQIVLEKINMGQDMIENHDVHPVRIVIVVKGDGRPGVDDGLIWVVGI